MTETFNLIDEPWIEVVDHDGKESIISIRDLLDKLKNTGIFPMHLGQ